MDQILFDAFSSELPHNPGGALQRGAWFECAGSFGVKLHLCQFACGYWSR